MAGNQTTKGLQLNYGESDTNFVSVGNGQSVCASCFLCAPDYLRQS